MDFEDEGAEEPDAEAWESEDDEGVEDGMEAQDDSEVTFSLHSGECWARAAAAGTPLGTRSHLGFLQSPGVWRALPGCCLPAFLEQPSGLRAALGLFLPYALAEEPFGPPIVAAGPKLSRKPVLLLPHVKNSFPLGWVERSAC